MEFCMKASDAGHARSALMALSGRLGLPQATATTLNLAATLPNASAFIGWDGSQWRAETTPFVAELTWGEFIEEFRGEVEESLEHAINGPILKLTTQLGAARTSMMYQIQDTEGIENAERLVIIKLEQHVNQPSVVHVDLVPHGSTKSFLQVNGVSVAIREGTPSVARAFLVEHSSIFKEKLQ